MAYILANDVYSNGSVVLRHLRSLERCNFAASFLE